MSEHVLKSREYELLFGVRRSIRYHARRRRFFERARKGITFLTVAAGVSTLATLLARVDAAWPVAMAGLVSLLGAMELVLNTAEGSRLHAELGRRFIELELDIVRAGGNLNDQQIRDFAGRRLHIELEEPPTMRVLDCVCHNELVQLMGQGNEYEVRLTRLQRFFANFMDICPAEIRLVPERKVVLEAVRQSPVANQFPGPVGTT